MTMPRAGIALGSNLGNRLANLRAAHARLRDIATPGASVLTAPLYQTTPHLCPSGSPDFLNTVVEIGFEGSPLELLEMTRGIERELGRVLLDELNAPRPIDLDILYLGETCFDNSTLILPHPRIGERRFVLQPLSDIRPDLVLPGQSRTVAQLLEYLPPEDPTLLGGDDRSWIMDEGENPEGNGRLARFLK